MKKVRYLVYGLFGASSFCARWFSIAFRAVPFPGGVRLPVCLVLFLLKALLVPGRRLRIALPDVLLALYLSRGACNLLFVKAGGTDALPIFEWISLLLGYLLARSVPERAVPLVLGSDRLFAGAGGGRFLQWLDVLPSNHNLFPVTGSFMNRAYGGYLPFAGSSAPVWRSGRYAETPRRLPDGRLRCHVEGLLVLSDSRAAWLCRAAGAGLAACRAAGI